MASEEFEAGDPVMRGRRGMARRKMRPMLMDAKYVWRRRWAAAVIIGRVVFFTMLIYPVLDGLAEGACVTQLDNKAAWAVEYSKARGGYVYE